MIDLRKNINQYINWEQLAYDMDNDLGRYPLPICFDPHEEQREFFRRTMRIKDIAQRWFRIDAVRAITRALKQKGITCRSCWWVEGGRCYISPCKRMEGGRSTKLATEVCSGHTSKRSVLGALIPNIIITSEEKAKSEGKSPNAY